MATYMIINSLHVANDYAEYAVAFIYEYSDLISHNKTLLQVAEY